MSLTSRVRTQAHTQSTEKPTAEVVCTGHNRRASCFIATTSANNGRWFYTCPLGKDNKDRCKFFKWADQLSPVKGGGNVLGGSGSASASASVQSPKSPFKPTNPVDKGRDRDPGGSEEIDWGAIDVDELERDAEIRATPRASQSSARSQSLDLESMGAGAGAGLQAKLAAVSGEKGKRKREEDGEGGGDGDVERTPKRGTANPFFNTPGTGASTSTVFETPAGGNHPALGPLLLAIPEVNEHLLRADRRVRAAESMKKSMRASIKSLQERVRELENELEALRK